MILVYTKEDLLNLAIKNMVDEGWLVNTKDPTDSRWCVEVDAHGIRLEITIPEEGE